MTGKYVLDHFIMLKSKIMVYLLSFMCYMVRRASDFGLMKIDEKGRVINFSEKPKGDDLKAMVCL